MHICLAIFYVQCDAKLSDFHVHMAICCASASYRYKHRKTFFFMFFNHVFLLMMLLLLLLAVDGLRLVFYLFFSSFLQYFFSFFINVTLMLDPTTSHIFIHILPGTHIFLLHLQLFHHVYSSSVHTICATRILTLWL